MAKMVLQVTAVVERDKDGMNHLAQAIRTTIESQGNGEAITITFADDVSDLAHPAQMENLQDYLTEYA